MTNKDNLEGRTEGKSAFEVKEIKKMSTVPDGRAIITVPHLEDKVNFAYPPFMGTYDNVKIQIVDAGLKEPTPEEVASLVYSAYENLDDEYAQEIKNMMKSDHCLWMFNTITFVPNEGAYIQKPDKEIFVPFGYKMGNQSALELSKNKFVIGLFGEEGAEKIARVAEKYNPFLYLGGYRNKDLTYGKKKIMKPTLNIHYDWSDKFQICGGLGCYKSNGGAFGVKK